MRFKLELNKDPRTIDKAVYYAVPWVQLKYRSRHKCSEARRIYEDSDFDERQTLRRINSQRESDTKTESKSEEPVTYMLKKC